MPLSINVGLSRKASKDYQSTGFSINVTAELDQSLLARPDELQAQIDALYSQAHHALDKQAGSNQPQQTSQPQRQPSPRNNGGYSRNGNAGPRNGGNGNGQGYRLSNGNGNGGGRTNAGGMTESQGKAIYAISKRLGVDAGYECKEVFGWDFDHLTIKQASELIDHLKALQPQENGGGRNGGGR